MRRGDAKPRRAARMRTIADSLECAGLARARFPPSGVPFPERKRSFRSAYVRVIRRTATRRVGRSVTGLPSRPIRSTTLSPFVTTPRIA